MDDLIQDLRYACRQLLRAPSFAVITILTLALGIGANTAIFSAVRGVFLLPLPYAHGSRIVHIGYQEPRPGLAPIIFSAPDIEDYRKQVPSFQEVMEYHSMSFNLVGNGEPDEVKTGVVSTNFLPGFGIQPLLGRTFRPEEDKPGADPVLMLTYDYWQRRFGGNPAVVGQVLEMNGKGIRVVGVLPPLPKFPGKDDILIPLSSCPVRSNPQLINSRASRMMTLFGELRPGARLPQAQAEVATVARRLREEYPESYARVAAPETVPVVSIQEEMTSHFRPTLLLLLLTVGLVLLLACANVANLLLARLMNREKEVSVRCAIGAG
ncbi:MAG TPA: ABC transporter permease, partial [Thermoanaerobaculia bacterium]|nr:ABC transporter permease [Thermoanaerobaculia bacterium]